MVPHNTRNRRPRHGDGVQAGDGYGGDLPAELMRWRCEEAALQMSIASNDFAMKEAPRMLGSVTASGGGLWRTK
jgi:hypothetical protein